MEKEKERHSRYYHNRSEPSRSFDYKNESVKTSTTGKTTESISDIDDIISQISGPKESASTSKSEGSTYTKNDPKESGLPSTSTYNRSDSSLPKQQVSGSHSKSEPSKKGDNSSVSEIHRSTTPSKTSVDRAKKITPSKRVIPKTIVSQNTGTTSEKPADASNNPRAKGIYNKPSSSPKVESPMDNTDVEKPTPKVPENVSSLKSDSHRTSPLSNVSKGLHEKSKHSEVSGGLHVHARQKMEDKHIDSNKFVPENIKPVEVESKVEEKPSIETHLKTELQEKKTKDSSLLEKPQVEQNRTDVVSSSDHDDQDTAVKDRLPEDSESDLESDVSDVSSVHTSDLSSFDGEVSSDSYHSDDDTRKGSRGEKSHSKKESGSKGDQSLGHAKSDSGKGRKNLNRGTSKGTKMETQMKKSGTSSTSSSDTTTKRKRGRPRKDRSETENKESRDLKQGRSRQEQHQQQQHQQVDRESSDSMPARDRSKRPIKKKRCYSPSSEGSREVCLPSKRSRVSSKD